MKYRLIFLVKHFVFFFFLIQVEFRKDIKAGIMILKTGKKELLDRSDYVDSYANCDDDVLLDTLGNNLPRSGSKDRRACDE